MRTRVRWTYDAIVDALYVRLADLPIARTVVVSGSLNVDMTEDQQVVGVEVLGVSQLQPGDIPEDVVPENGVRIIVRLVRASRGNRRATTSSAVSANMALDAESGRHQAHPARAALLC